MGFGKRCARLGGFLVTMRTAEILMVITAILCLIATLVPQAPHGLIPHDTPAMRILMLASLTDTFHSLWFLGVAVAMVVAGAACMVLRLKPLKNRGSEPPPHAVPLVIEGVSDPGRLRESLKERLSQRFCVRPSPPKCASVIVAERGSVRRLSGLAIHLGVVLVVLGALGGLFGFKGTVSLGPDRTQDALALPDGTHRKLGFALRCRDFSVEHYPGGMPREYRAVVEFVEEGGGVETRTIMVNHPVYHRGILFSLSGFDETAQAVITVKGPEGTRRLVVEEGSVVHLGDGATMMVVDRISEDMMRMGPGIRLVPVGGGADDDLWLFRDIGRIEAIHPGITATLARFNPRRYTPFVFTLEDVRYERMTFLTANRDPGIWLVGVGAVLFLAGLGAAFLVDHEVVWVAVPEGQEGAVTISYMKNGRQEVAGRQILDCVQGRPGRPG